VSAEEQARFRLNVENYVIRAKEYLEERQLEARK
jgi:hypothetical protein